MDSKTSLQAQMLANRLQKRFRHLKKWAQKTNIGVFRLYDRDIPEIPLVLDFYGDGESSALCGSLYKRPYEKDENEETCWLSAMKEAVSSALNIKSEHIFLKQRQKQRGESQYEKMGRTRFEKTVMENGLSFKVNLSDYLDTGLFIDRRLLRAIVRTESAGKKVLNLFSYTGSFSVYAAAGGAVSTDSVDLSNTYLNWAQDNFLLNGFSAELVKYFDDFFCKGSRDVHKLVCVDVLKFLDKAIAAKRRWDIIILDPPAFSNSKKMADNFDLSRDLTDLLIQCLTLLSSGGKIFLSINLRRNAPTAEELEIQLRRKAPFADVRLTDLSGKITDEDFKNRKIPKAYSLTAHQGS